MATAVLDYPSNEELFDHSAGGCQPTPTVNGHMQQATDAYGAPLVQHQQQQSASPLAAAKQQYVLNRQAAAQAVGAPVAQQQQRVAAAQQQQVRLPPGYAAALGIQQPVAAQAPPAAQNVAAQQHATPGGAAAAAAPAVAQVETHLHKAPETKPLEATKEALARLRDQRAIKTREYYGTLTTNLHSAATNPEMRQIRVNKDSAHIFQYRMVGKEDQPQKGLVSNGVVLKAHIMSVHSGAPVDLGLRIIDSGTGRVIAPGRVRDMVTGQRYIYVAHAHHTTNYGKKGLKVHEVRSLSGLAVAARYAGLNIASIAAEIEPLPKAPHIYMVPLSSPVIALIQKNQHVLGVNLAEAQRLAEFLLIHRDIVEAILHELKVRHFDKNILDNLGNLAIEISRTDAAFNSTNSLVPVQDHSLRINSDILQRPFQFSVVLRIKYLITDNIPSQAAEVCSQ
jgi:hypothetical protein